MMQDKRKQRAFLRLGTVLMVLAGAAVLLGMPLGTKAAAADLLKVGLLEEPRTLNIWLASDAWSRKVLNQIYEPLYVREPKNLDLIPWLAESEPLFDPENLAYTVRLRPAKWSDGSEFTSEDVAFTGRFIQEFDVPRYSSKWNFISKIETPDKHTIIFFLEEPQAIFLSRTLTTPIVQKKEWEPIAEAARKTEKPLTTLLNHQVKKPVGTGAFMLEEWRQGAYLYLKRNDLFFGKGKEIGGRRLGPHLDGIIFKVFGTSDAAVLALKKGTVDMFWWGIQPGYLDDLKAHEEIELFYSEKSALYYMGMNCRRPPFDDVNLRRAVAMLVDKDFIISRILQGQATKMHSVVPPGNTFWHCPDVPRYGDGLSRQDRIRKAYEILKAAGYSWDTAPVDGSGNVVQAEGMRTPEGSPLGEITILTPPADYDPNRAMAGQVIQGWLREMGVRASARPMAFGSLVQEVKVRRDFDAFILGYGHLSLDPDYVRYFFHSAYDEIRGQNKSGYRNPEFDRIADASAKEMDRQKRREMIREMQKIIIRDVPFVPLYNPHLIEAVRNDHFRGWVQMLEGIGNVWSFCELKPVK